MLEEICADYAMSPHCLGHVCCYYYTNKNIKNIEHMCKAQNKKFSAALVQAGNKPLSVWQTLQQSATKQRGL